MTESENKVMVWGKLSFTKLWNQHAQELQMNNTSTIGIANLIPLLIY